MTRLTILAASLFVLAGPALAKDCRIPDPKPGQAIEVPEACKDVVRAKSQQADAIKGDKGAIDLGHGTTLRIGGRMRAETTWRH
ncbi:hypothetical protein [Microvirga sp. G4-2]|uniref:hypothetical protein n=1 Tax=Microvirga sp. G4-2 TaxID=3434467 RepID=UPI004043CAA0